MKFKPLPIGVDDFEKIREQGYYYVDKTLLIKELLDMKGEVNLFTRPRRFGKTLNLSMLQCFFEKGHEERKMLFEGLEILKAGERYTRHMFTYPVITISLKAMKQSNYELSYIQMTKILGEEFRRHDRVLESESLTEAEKDRYRRIRDIRGEAADYLDSLKFLSACLFKAEKKKVIILIDEYDVPLENAYFGGFYDPMLSVIRSLFESGLKTNENMDFAVITGCLRISRESIFTGLNNLKMISITNPAYAEHFGFTEKEVLAMLRFYGQENAMGKMKSWYDGYLFGQTEVYNPWSVINYIEQLWINTNAFPQPFWSNTSSNHIVRNLIEGADASMRQEIESLIQGGTVEKAIHEEITYEDMGERENLWSFLFFTGYLKKTGERIAENLRYISLAIPNEEVRYIYKYTVLAWFERKIKRKNLTEFYQALLQGNVEETEKTITALLREGISFYDNKEAFYHGFLMGLLSGMEDYYPSSNREAGDGRYDICLKSLDIEKPAILLEMKLADSYRQMEEKSRQAVKQIENRHYEEEMARDGFCKVLCYGIAFYKKNCRIVMEEKKIENAW